MDDETKTALEAVYGRIDQFSVDLLGDKDKPGIFEALRNLITSSTTQQKAIDTLAQDVRRLTWQHVFTQNTLKSINTRLEDGDKKLSALDPAQQAASSSEIWKQWRRNLILYIIPGLISATYGWWLGQHQITHPLPPAVTVKSQGESQ